MDEGTGWRFWVIKFRLILGFGLMALLLLFAWPDCLVWWILFRINVGAVG